MQSGAKELRRVRGLGNRGLMGPGRAASPLQVIKEEAGLEPSRDGVRST